jgi:hypothetical protein
VVHDDDAQDVATTLGVSLQKTGVRLDVAMEVIDGDEQPVCMSKLATCQTQPQVKTVQ